ncbi:ATP-binding protein [Streptomyces goshikiensis]|uniref:ATP-binding protein n=1 Tax=Streptomyces goshikiensis TaxID=1942 RepID=UPI002E10F28C|nr:AAA family ATPase [Streptomyces goshikiensis]
MRREHARLLERDRESELLEEGLLQAREGSGGMVVLEGATGLGKTSLLRTTRESASQQGFVVLSARGCALEQDFAWTIVRQLFELCPGLDSTGEDTGILSGPAAMARSLFDYRQLQNCPASRPDEDLYSALHGLYWLCRNLSERRPLLLMIDDAQWADAESLRFVSYLVNRIEDHAVLVALASTPTDEPATPELLMTACAAPLVKPARLGALSAEAVHQLASEILGRAPHEAFTHACLTMSEGNPLHLLELLEDAAREGIAPVETEAPRVYELTPARAAWGVRRQLTRLPDTAVALAGAVAVLTSDAEPRHCARVAGLDEADATEAAGRLRDAGLLTADAPYRFVRPVIHQVVYEGMAAQARNAAHRTAAECLGAAGTAAVRSAEHLCRTDPDANPWAVSILRSASREVLGGGDALAATRYLRRAMAESPAQGVDLGVLAELGAAELRAQQASALEHLEKVLRQGAQPHAELTIRLDLGHALAAVGRPEDALAAIDPGSWAADRTEGAQAWAAAMTIQRLAGDRGDRAGSRSRPGLDPLTLRAHAAAGALSDGRPALRAARLARAAVADGVRLPAHDVELPPASLAAWVLAQCDDPLASEGILNEVVGMATRDGHVLTAATARSLRAAIVFDTGRIADAEAAAREVLRQRTGASLALTQAPLAAAVLVQCLIEQDRPQEADELLERHGMAGELPRNAVHLPLRVARGRLHAALGRRQKSVQELLDCRSLARKHRWHNSSATGGWLATVVHGVAMNSGQRAARELAFAEVRRASSVGASRPLAAALCAYGEMAGGKEGIRHIEQAEQLLAGLTAPVEHARTLLALGAAIRRTGDRSEARHRLTTALELARNCGAAALEQEIGAELRLTGARLSPAAGETVSLTPAEHRVAQQASAGLTNREIAQALFITVKTVEWHLGQAYSKLGIRKRAELTRALSLVPEDPGPERRSA